MTTSEEIALIKEKAAQFLNEQLDLIKDLVSVDSRAGRLTGNITAIERIEMALAPLKARTERLPAEDLGFHLIAKCGRLGAKRKILSLAHIDTLPTLSPPSQNPFRVEGNIAYGEGVADCKGGAAVLIYGTRLAIELGLVPKDTEFTLIFYSDEQLSSASSRQLIENEAQTAQMGFVFEPCEEEDEVVTARRGTAYGFITVEAQTKSEGRERQGGLTGGGVTGGTITASSSDANRALVGAISDLYDFSDPWLGVGDGSLTGLGGGLAINVGLIAGGQKADEVAQKAQAKFFVSFADEWELWHINRALQSMEIKNYVPGCRVSLALENTWPPFERDQNVEQLYRLYLDSALKLGYEAINEKSSYNPSAASWCSHYRLPTIDALGPHMLGTRGRNESILISSLTKKTAIFAMVLNQIKELRFS
ncbi:MAG: M20/M25/M40 family metallo-hydrolase [Deltaproteobacteria bacterium]|jgi:glutamate carboxypeptidase|nr:M20/M25/M40 family metallo-hydrolase [Deltaproteobacteria bacterium]